MEEQRAIDREESQQAEEQSKPPPPPPPPPPRPTTKTGSNSNQYQNEAVEVEPRAMNSILSVDPQADDLVAEDELYRTLEEARVEKYYEVSCTRPCTTVCKRANLDGESDSLFVPHRPWLTLALPRLRICSN